MYVFDKLIISLGIIPSYIGNILQYDDDGNLISSVNGEDSETYTYNSKNNLTSCGQTEYTYDAEGNRIKISVGENETRYLYDTSQSLPKVIKRTHNGISTIYVYGKELISEKTDDDTSYYHFDYRGSTVALTDKNGKITDKYQYDVYGNSRHTEGDSDTPFRYNGSAGVMTDANNLLYMKSRYYNPELLRFISADILTGDISNTQSLNRYTYCEGNPVSFSDPFGLSREVKQQKQEQIEAAKREQISQRIHGTLDVAGMAPGVGMVADGLNVVIYAAEGNLAGASFSATAFIPVVGALSTPSKYGGKLVLATAESGANNVLGAAGKHVDDAAELIFNKNNVETYINEILNTTEEVNSVYNNGKKVFDNFNIDTAYVKPKHLSTTKGNGNKFLGMNKIEAEAILRDTLKNGKISSISADGITPQGNSKYEIIIDAGKEIGIKGETKVKIVLSDDGGMLSAYPYK